MDIWAKIPLNYLEKTVQECLEKYLQNYQGQQSRQEHKVFQIQISESMDSKDLKSFFINQDGNSENSQTSSCLREQMRIEALRIRKLDRETIFQRKRKAQEYQEYPKDKYIINVFAPDSNSENKPVGESSNQKFESIIFQQTQTQMENQGKEQSKNLAEQNQ